MKLDTERHCKTRTTWTYVVAVLGNHGCALRRATSNVGAKSRSYKTKLTEPGITTGKKVAPSFMERILMGHNVTSVTQDMTGTVGERDSNDTERKPETPLKGVVSSSSNKRGETEHVLADLGEVTKVNVRAIDESCLTK